MKRDDDRLKRLVLALGPVTVPFRSPASLEDGAIALAWANLSGPLNTPCNETLGAEHLMLMVGWTADYWILKNSYGTKSQFSLPWGEEGYVYLNRTLAQGCGLFGDGKPRPNGDGYFTGIFTFPILE